MFYIINNNSNLNFTELLKVRTHVGTISGSQKDMIFYFKIDSLYV
jgi:hypothetical protein